MEPVHETTRSRSHLRNFGIGRSKGYGQHPHIGHVSEDTTVWDIYNDQASLIDNERIRDWNDSLNTLLIFAALYSAVLTAFIIESMRLIQEDSSGVTRDVLLAITQQLANSSAPAYKPASFNAPQWALRVNYCLFFSLSCSLITALAAVLSLQWVGSYDRGLNPSSAEERALQRHFRSEGAKRWKMEHIIAFLPAIIFISLFIFFVGLADWLWHVQLGMAIVPIAAISIGAFFYWITTTISMISIEAPFRTPVSRMLPLFNGRILKSFSKIVSSLRSKKPRDLLNWIPRIRGLFQPIDYRQQMTVLGKAIGRTFSRFCSLKPFESRELEAVDAAKHLKRDSLFWLARSISIGSYQRPSLRIIIKAIIELPPQDLYSNDRDAAPWMSIFRILYEPLLENKGYIEYFPGEEEDAVLCMRSLASIGQEFYNDHELVDLFNHFYPNYDNSETMCDILASWKYLEAPSRQHGTSSQDIVLKSYRHCLQHWSEYPLEFSVIILQNILKTLSQNILNTRNWGFLPTIAEIMEPIKDSLYIGVDAMTSSTTTPEKIFNLILEIIAVRLGSSPSSQASPVSCYLLAVEAYFQTSKENLSHRAHVAVVRHLIAKFSQSEVPNALDSPTTYEDLMIMARVVESPLWKEVRRTERDPMLLAMSETGLDLWNEENQLYSAQILAFVIPDRFDFIKDKNWSNWWIQVIIGFGDILELDGDLLEPGSRNIDPQLQNIVINNAYRMLSSELPKFSDYSQDDMKKLDGLLNPLIRLLASVVTRSAELAIGLSSIAKDGPTFAPWDEFIETCYQYLIENVPEPSLVFLRAFAIMCSTKLYRQIHYAHIRQFAEPRLRNFFTWRVLFSILKFPQTGMALESLELIAKYDWFTAAFVMAEGPSWLDKLVKKSLNVFNRVLGVILGAFISSKSFKHSFEWLNCTRHCLLSAGLRIGGEDFEISRYRDGIAENCRLLAEEFRKTRLLEDRQLGFETYLDDNPNGAASIIPGNISWRHTRIPEVISDEIEMEIAPDETEGAWTTQQWTAWKKVADEVISGLERGWIVIDANEPEAWNRLAVEVIDRQNEARPAIRRATMPPTVEIVS